MDRSCEAGYDCRVCDQLVAPQQKQVAEWAAVRDGEKEPPIQAADCRSCHRIDELSVS